VASDVLGVSGRAMLEALVGGTTDPEVLADLARGSLGNKLPALREALQAGSHLTTGCWWPSCWPTWTTWTRRSSD
jgi:hypothetical protein